MTRSTVIRVVVLAFAFLAVAVPAGAKPGFSFAAAPGKLPKDVQPSAYRIDLVPDLTALTFKGKVEIDIDVAKPTDTIMLNAVGLTFAGVRLKGDDAKPVITTDAKAQTAKFVFPHSITAGRHTLSIGYSGPISAQPSGIYYNDYDTPNGRKRLLTTQFEPADARRMFPGWDEPAFKATFTLSAIVPETFRTISNMPISREEPAGTGLKKVSFPVTPKMSSYLLVLVSGELERITRTVGTVEIGVVTVKGKAEQGRQALEAAARLLPYYNEYFAAPYPLPKLDLIAIPGNYAYGAMENWGGITYIDSALLFDPAHSTESTRQYLFSIIAHEMAHQWTGDLVTMGWWDNIWLNEGFASWMQAKATDALNPTWHAKLRAQADLEAAMRMDARRTTHPVQQPVADESQALAAFDDIAYLKGASFLRMIEAYVGEAPFQAAIRHYIKDHAYSNTNAADLWTALEKESGKPVAEIAAGFIEQPGVPLLHVDSKCVEGDTVATLTLDRFTIHDPSASKLRWKVPVTVSRFADDDPTHLLMDDRPQTLKFVGCGKMILANFGGNGYYRLAFDDIGLRQARAYARYSPFDRLRIVSDAWAMVQSGSDAAQFLNITRRLGTETEYAAWAQVTATFKEIDDLERGAPDREAFHAYVRGVMQPIWKQVDWNSRYDEADDTPLLRALVITTLGRFGDSEVITEAKRRFDAFLSNPASLPPNLQDAVVTVVGYSADRQTYDALHKLGQAATDSESKMRYYAALASAPDPALMAETAKIVLSGELSSSLISRVLPRAAQMSDDPDRVWSLVLADRNSLKGKLSDYQRQSLLPRIAAQSSNPEIAAALKALPDSNVSAGARQEAARAAEDITIKAEFKKRLQPSVTAWLKANEEREAFLRNRGR